MIPGIPLVNVNSGNNPIASNGATAVTLCALAAGKSVYCSGTLVIVNEGSVAHTVQLLSSGGRVILEFVLAAGASTGQMLFDRADLSTASGEALQFKFTDGTGAVGDLKASGTVGQT